MGKIFNTTGQCDADVHYMVNLETRLAEIKALIEGGAFFSINKGRQYGKTTMLHALKRYLQGDYIVASLDFQFLSSESFKSEYTFVADFSGWLMRALRGIPGLKENILNEIKGCANHQETNLVKLFEYLSNLCGTAAKPVVLLIDEVDSAANNQVFLDFLAQLRGYYIHRKEFPIFQSVILAGVYDVKNLKSKIRPDSEHKINSPWNIAAKFKVNMDFTKTDIEGMLKEYERDYHTGMDIGTISQMIYDYTSGYPLLVSNLCKIIDEDLRENDKYTEKGAAWTKEGVTTAVGLILSDSNALFESLLRQLQEYPELKDILRTILFSGMSVSYNVDNHVIDVAAMFGFIKNVDGFVAIANRIFETGLAFALIRPPGVLKP